MSDKDMSSIKYEYGDWVSDMYQVTNQIWNLMVGRASLKNTNFNYIRGIIFCLYKYGKMLISKKETCIEVAKFMSAICQTQPISTTNYRSITILSSQY